MKCQQCDCNSNAEYHIQGHTKVCYEHLVALIKHSPDAKDKCACCCLIGVEAPKRSRLKKRIEEVTTRKTFSGEQSPYWNFEGGHHKYDQDGNDEENVFANPDMLMEDDSIFRRPLSDLGRLQLEIVQAAVKDLSPQQQKVLYLCGQLGKSQGEAAKELGIGKSAVCKLLQRVQRIILEQYQIALKKLDD